MFRLQLQRIRYPLRPAGPSFGHPSGNSVIARALSTTGNNSKPPHAFQHALARLEQIRQTALKIASNAHAKERKHKGHFDSQQRARSFNSHQTLRADKSHINFQNSNTAVSNQKESVPISATALSSSTSKNSRYVEKRTSSDGTIYQGQWVNDMMNGDMKITFPDGKIFTGTFHINTLVPGSVSFVHSHTSTLSVSTRRKHASFGPATDESVDKAALRTSVPLLGQAFEGVQHGSGVGLQRYPEGSVYEGETLGEKFHGQGTLTCPDGSSYSGHWAHDQRTLHGVATSTDGTVYAGEWAHNSMLGKGEIVYKSGDRLTGDFVFGVLYKGTGTIHGTDSVYVGDWDYGCMHGSGEYTKRNGFAYTGEWKYGLRDGEGKQVYSDGSVYTGTFLQDVYHGSGKVVCADGATVEGTFVHGELCGKGVRILADGTVHRGIFQGDSMKGEIYYPDGEKFTGMVRALLPYSGQGTVRTANTTYTGEVERGEKHGSGAFTFPDGRVYQGMWQRGLMHGEGVLRCSAGSARGTFKQGRLHDGSGVMLVEGRKVWGKWVAGAHQKESVKEVERPERNGVRANTIDEKSHEITNDTLTATTSATTSTNNANTTSTSSTSTSTSPLLNGPGTLTLPDGRILTGTFVNSLIQGTGTMTDPVKRLTYTGMFHNNKPHGQGSLVCAKGSKWEGTFVEGFLHGFGTRYVREGAHYTGMFRNAMYHGAGKSVIDDFLYEGEYEMGKKHGTGKLSVVGVFTFEGEWRHDKREGYGVNTNISNNTTYKGMYRDNLFHGEGCITNRHGTYSGAFERGERHGSGVFTANGVQVNGEWVNNRLHGVATITSTAVSTGSTAAANTTSPNASTTSTTSTTTTSTANATSHSVRGLFNHNILLYQVNCTDEPDRNVDKLWERLPAYKSTDLFAPERKFYIGETQDNLKHGYGRFVFADGRVYQGMWQRGLMHGEGVLRCSAGSARGEWREGQVYTAEGVMTDERGTVYEGKWVNGVRTGPFKITFPSGVTLQTHGADGDEVFRKPRSKNNNSRSELRKAPSTATADTTSSPDSEEVYTGDKKDGIPHGRGKLVRNGESWEGTFVHGEFTGVGIYRSIFSTSYNTGNYTTASGWGGKMISNSTSSNKVGIDKRGTVYVGHFANFTFCGKGKLHTDGKIYEGTFLENRLHGYGKCIDEIGIYEGEWAQGRRHGAGTLVQEGGNSIVDGVWFNNMLQRTASRPFVK